MDINADQAQLIVILYQDGKGKDPRDFEGEFIVGAWMAGASVTKTAQLFHASMERVT